MYVSGVLFITIVNNRDLMRKDMVIFEGSIGINFARKCGILGANIGNP